MYSDIYIYTVDVLGIATESKINVKGVLGILLGYAMIAKDFSSWICGEEMITGVLSFEADQLGQPL